jgi:hypothetical protein
MEIGCVFWRIGQNAFSGNPHPGEHGYVRQGIRLMPAAPKVWETNSQICLCRASMRITIPEA